MSLAQWPESLPQAPLRDITVNYENNVSITQFASGTRQRRLRFSKPKPSQTSINLILTKAQLTTFINFYVDDINYGASPFEWRDLVTGETKEFYIINAPSLTNLRPGQITDRLWQITVDVEGGAHA